jgi:hypothetical protein
MPNEKREGGAARATNPVASPTDALFTNGMIARVGLAAPALTREEASVEFASLLLLFVQSRTVGTHGNRGTLARQSSGESRSGAASGAQATLRADIARTRSGTA